MSMENVYLEKGSHLFKFLPGDSLTVKLSFSKYTLVKVEVFEYDIDRNYELKLT